LFFNLLPPVFSSRFFPQVRFFPNQIVRTFLFLSFFCRLNLIGVPAIVLAFPPSLYPFHGLSLQDNFCYAKCFLYFPLHFFSLLFPGHLDFHSWLQNFLGSFRPCLLDQLFRFLVCLRFKSLEFQSQSSLPHLLTHSIGSVKKLFLLIMVEGFCSLLFEIVKLQIKKFRGFGLSFSPVRPFLNILLRNFRLQIQFLLFPRRPSLLRSQHTSSFLSRRKSDGILSPPFPSSAEHVFCTFTPVHC